MQTFDYLRFFDADYVTRNAAFEQFSVAERYGSGSAISYRLLGQSCTGYQEVVRLADDLLLIIGEVSPIAESIGQQIITDGDWIHIQFRLSGGGEESVSAGSHFDTHPRSCTLVRYPRESIVRRKAWQADHWRAVCLFFRPSAVTSFFGIPKISLPPSQKWIFDEGEGGIHHRSFAMGAPELLNASDIFHCSLSGDLRKAFMRGKAIELFTLAVSRLFELDVEKPPIPLSRADVGRIRKVPDILIREISTPLTLEQIGRRVGVNRSRLAMGFKALYGNTVQAYWRELRLERARELLMIEQKSVTEVASAVGYADISCLTRAFERRYGVLPKSCKMRVSPPRDT
jgi:AraC-like DNA-binding protein